MTTLMYVDPTGGLPPPVWGMMLAALLGGLAALGTAIRLWGARLFAALRTHAVRFVVVLLVTLVAGSIMGFLWFRRPTSTNTGATSPRVLVLAFDGLDPQLVERYLADGRLPNFARLKSHGLYHPLATSEPPQSPVAWSTFITGEPPASHGVFDFVKRDPKTYLPDLSIADRRNMTLPWTGTPIWERPAVARLGFVAHRLPMVFPPPKVNGRVLAGMGVWDMRGTEGTYIYFTTASEKIPGARGMVMPLTADGRMLRGGLPGPYRAGEADTLREPFELELSPDRAAATLRLQDVSYPLTPGRWSDWVSVEFRMGALALQKAKGITRVLLTVDDKNISLYVSPLQFDPRASMYPLSHPRSWSADLVDAIGLYATRGMPFDTQAVNDGVLSDDAFLTQVEAITDESERMLMHDLPGFSSGVLFSYFLGSDVVQHMFWRGIDPESPLYGDAETRRHADAIPRYYERCDAILGRAVAAMNNRGAVVVISDHGFAPFRRSAHLNAILRDTGWLALKEGKSTSGELMADVDWSKTRAYAVGLNAVYLNLAGREQHGIVKASDAASQADALADALEQWTDPETNARPIVRVHRQAGGALAPDLIVGYVRGYRASWETALGAVPEKTSESNTKKWSGDHCIEATEVPGVFFSSDKSLDAASLANVGAAIDHYLAKRMTGDRP
ncbi:MAG: alkaline phosphatase family protein [Planctomycetes bacterium]|nr:alkaline phosphatase family protein [Planctomycetota bacterium]